MWRFFVKKEIDPSGMVWSPETMMFCPFCHEKNTFYTQLPENKCKYCHKVMPFPSAMVKSEKSRIEYHLSETYHDQTDTEGNS